MKKISIIHITKIIASTIFAVSTKIILKNSLKITFNKKKFKIINKPMFLKKFDKLNLKCKPKLIKIDVEGFDYEV